MPVSNRTRAGSSKTSTDDADLPTTRGEAVKVLQKALGVTANDVREAGGDVVVRFNADKKSAVLSALKAAGATGNDGSDLWRLGEFTVKLSQSGSAVMTNRNTDDFGA